MNKIYLVNSYDPVDKIILEKNHCVCGRQLDVQKAQSRDGSQRSGSMRSRQGPSSMSRSNYNSGYNNYQQDTYNGQFGQMPNNNYNGYGTNFNEGNGNWTSFGQGFVLKFDLILRFSMILLFRYGQESVGGPMRRGNIGSGGGRGYSPYNGRGGGGGRGRGGGNRGGPSWTSWD